MLIECLDFLLHLELFTGILHVLGLERVDVKGDVLRFPVELSLGTGSLGEHSFEVLSTVIFLFILLLNIRLLVTQLLIRLLLIHQLLVQVLQLEVLAFGFLSGLVDILGQFGAVFVLFFQHIGEVGDPLLVRVDVPSHALDPHLVRLDVAVSGIAHVQLSGDVLFAFVGLLQLFLVVAVQTVEVPLQTLHSCVFLA